MMTPFEIETHRYIAPPADWNEAKDRHEFEVRYGSAENYRRAIVDQLIEEYRNFNEVLDHVLAHFTDGLEIASLMGPALTAREKMDWLLALVVDVEKDAKIRDRLLKNLAYCAWVENERHRLLQAIRHPLAVVWVAPLCQLADEMTTAAMQLEESLICEHKDYGEERVAEPANRTRTPWKAIR